MNKKALYESIMKNVAKEVKKALNENKQEQDVVIYDNYQPNYTDEDFEDEWEERGDEENEKLFYDYMREHHEELFQEYLHYNEDDEEADDENENRYHYYVDEEITNADIDDYFDTNDNRDEYFKKYKAYEMEKWIEDMEAFEWNEIEIQLKKVQGDFIVYGTKEKWDHTDKGLDVEDHTNLLTIVQKQGKDCDYFKITELADGGIKLKCTHHDGTNEVVIHLLNEHGQDLAEDLLMAADRDEEKVYLKQLIEPAAWADINLDF